MGIFSYWTPALPALRQVATGLTAAPVRAQAAPFFNGSFGCDDVEYTYSQLKERGVEFQEEPTKQHWGTYAIFKDPDGNSFVLGSK